MSIQPYLFLDGKCEEAIEFYKQALDAKVEMLMRFGDSPEPPQGMAPGMEKKVMHATLKVGTDVILASDGQCGGKPSFQGFALSLTLDDAAEAEKRFKALSAGGRVDMPLTKTFFSPSFGMLADKFGVSWMVYVQPKP